MESILPVYLLLSKPHISCHLPFIKYFNKGGLLIKAQSLVKLSDSKKNMWVGCMKGFCTIAGPFHVSWVVSVVQYIVSTLQKIHKVKQLELLVL